jgi:SAM-dependent methyltransferase
MPAQLPAPTVITTARPAAGEQITSGGTLGAAMSIKSRFFARVYDSMMAGAEAGGLQAHRQALLADLKGQVLEVGAGTGSNLPFYPAEVESLTLTEPDIAMVRRLSSRLPHDAPAARLLRAPAEDLPFEPDSFDVAVSVLVLCSVDDQPRALRELRRVLRPGGLLLFIEHVRAGEPSLARRQDRFNGLNRLTGFGCNCNRRTADSIGAAGFTILRTEHDTLTRVPPLVRPLVIGSAEADKN